MLEVSVMHESLVTRCQVMTMTCNLSCLHRYAAQIYERP